MTASDSHLEIRNAKKSFGRIDVLHDISLSVKKGEIVALIGPSGSGKSTLLRAINDLEPLTSGEVWLEGVHVNKRFRPAPTRATSTRCGRTSAWCSSTSTCFRT